MAGPINVYGFPHSERGKQGVPASNEVLDDPGHEVRAFGEKYEGMGPVNPSLNQGLGEEPLEDGGRAIEDRVYGNDGTTLIHKGVPSSKAL